MMMMRSEGKWKKRNGLPSLGNDNPAPSPDEGVCAVILDPGDRDRVSAGWRVVGGALIQKLDSPTGQNDLLFHCSSCWNEMRRSWKDSNGSRPGHRSPWACVERGLSDAGQTLQSPDLDSSARAPAHTSSGSRWMIGCCCLGWVSPGGCPEELLDWARCRRESLSAHVALVESHTRFRRSLQTLHHHPGSPPWDTALEDLLLPAELGGLQSFDFLHMNK